MKKIVGFVLSLALSLAIFTSPVFADTVSTNFESYALGVINAQDGWSALGSAGSGCAIYDHAVNSSLSTTGFGSQSLRISNATASGCFGDQTFSLPLVDAVGETGAGSGTFSTGTLQPHFETEFDIASAVPGAQQPGLFLSVSPDRGDGSRMSYLGFSDVATGINIIFYDTPGETSPANFNFTDLGIFTRNSVHHIKLTMDVIDGPSNDVVKVYVDGNLVHTGTSWENYYRFDTEASAEQNVRAIRTLLFRSGGTGVPSTLGNGFLIDNLSLTSASNLDTTAPTIPVITGFKSPDMACGVITNAHTSTVDWSVSTDASGIAGYEYYVDYPLVGGGRGVWNPTTLWTATENFGSLNEGVHHIKVRAKDLAGIYSEWSNECDITADWTAPVVNFLGFKDQSSNTYDSYTITKSCGSINNTGFISWEWQLANLESNPVSYLYTILTGPTAVGYSASTSQTHYNGQIPVVGNYTVSVVATDIAGNQSAPATCAVNYQLAQTWLTPIKESDCKKGGWKIFNKPAFKNQGQCEKFVEQLKKDDKDKDHKDEKNDKDDDHKDDSKLKRFMENLVLHRD